MSYLAPRWSIFLRSYLRKLNSIPVWMLAQLMVMCSSLSALLCSCQKPAACISSCITIPDTGKCESDNVKLLSIKLTLSYMFSAVFRYLLLSACIELAQYRQLASQKMTENVINKKFLICQRLDMSTVDMSTDQISRTLKSSWHHVNSWHGHICHPWYWFLE